MDHGVIPPDLLLVMVCPVHKGGSRGSPKNFLPVAQTSHLTKVFERVLRIVLAGFLEQQTLLPDSHHGFRASRSTWAQMLSYWYALFHDLEEGKGVDVIFSKLLTKLKQVCCCIN